MSVQAPLAPLVPAPTPQDVIRALRLNRYIPQFPTPKQAAYLLLPHREAFFGGAGGPGKSSALLIGALQDVHVPGYAALILRRTYSDLSLPGALMDRAHDWLDDTDAHWHGSLHTWEFPIRHPKSVLLQHQHPATLTFGYLEHEKDKFRYRSAEFQYIAFDELTQFLETQYRFLFSRLRRLKGSPVPLRMRSASNPGDVGHAWVKQRFLVEGLLHQRPFIPAFLRDNPHLDIEAYRQSLSHLDALTRQQIEDGDWDAMAEGHMFQRVWFAVVKDYPRDARLVRVWDFASTSEEQVKSQDPDYTVGTLLAEKGGQYWVVDVLRGRWSPGEVEELVKQTAILDSRRVDILLEQEPGSSGKIVVTDYQRRVLRGFTVRVVHATDSKTERAKPASSAAEARNIFLVEGPWITAWLDEIPLFPLVAHDDQTDTLAHGVNYFLQYPPLHVW